MDGITFSKDQQTAFDLYLRGGNVALYGSAGVGKTAILRHIKRDAESKGKVVQVCAMTGCAAILLECGAKTLHSWAGIGLGKDEASDILPRLYRSAFYKEMYRNTDILILDEVSMLSMKLFELVDDIARCLRFPFKREHAQFGNMIGNYVRSTYPFGGIQVIFSGDFFQLPPIGDSQHPATRAFCFESIRWEETFGDNQIQLKQIFRQKDPIFATILNEIRVGKLKKSSNDLLMQYVQRPVRLEETGGIYPTKIFPTKRKVDAYNMKKMSDITDSETHIFKWKEYHGDALPSIPPMCNEQTMLPVSNCSNEQLERELMYLKNNILCDAEISLKIGAQVMCIYNYDVSSPQPICNGSQGIVIGFSPAPSDDFQKWGKKTVFPEVLFQNGRNMLLLPHKWRSDRIMGIAIEQIPLILSWAVTIHKSQGATLDMAELDVGGDIFECGQTYVAMSRVKSLEGLYLASFDYKRIQINSKVRAFYDNLENRLGNPPPLPLPSPQDPSPPTTQAQAQDQDQDHIPIAIAVAYTTDDIPEACVKM